MKNSSICIVLFLFSYFSLQAQPNVLKELPNVISTGIPGYTKHNIATLFQKGESSFESGQYESAIALLSKIEAYLEREDREKMGYLTNIYLGLSYSSIGKQALALHYFEESLKFKTADSFISYANMGVVWRIIGEPSQALSVWDKAAEIAQRTEDTIRLVGIWNNSAHAFIDFKKYDTAEALFKKARGMHASTKDRYYTLSGLAFLYNERGMYTKALGYLTDSIKGINLFDNFSSEWFSLQTLLGMVYYNLAQYDTAKAIFLKAYTEGNRIKYIHPMIEISPFLSKIYARNGDMENAYKIISHYSDVQDSTYKKEKMYLLNSWTKAQISEKDKLLLQHRLQLIKKESQLKTRNLWIVVTISSIASLLFLLFYRFKHNREKIGRMKKDQEINELKAQIKGEEMERSRIATELHNGIAGQIWSAKMGIGLLKKQQLDHLQQLKLEVIYNQLQETADEIRNTAHNMLPDLLIQRGLCKALESFVEKTNEHSEIIGEFFTYGDLPRLNREIELSLFRIVQELVQNILKHADKATFFVVQIGCSEQALNITVEDNGNGFQLDSYPKGFGLKYIYEKIKMLNGQIDIKSKENSGTTVYIELDIANLF